jgi:tmRNA-binding protein
MIPDVTDKYPEAALLVDLARNVWNGDNITAKIEFLLSDRLKAEFLNLAGTNVQAVFITDSGARHIKKQHGQGEALRGQVDITPADFALIPLVLNEFDKAEHTETDKKGNKKILFSKKIQETIYLATIERGPNKVEVRTFWKMREPGASC